MKTTRRLTSLLLAVCMLVAILPAGMFTASAIGEVYTYNFAEDAKAYATSATALLKENSVFHTLSTHSTSTAAWRFIPTRNTATTVQHNTGADQVNYGIFVFANGNGINDYATFEIDVPTSGTYTFDFTYYDYTSGREFNMYLTPADNSTTFNYKNEGDNQFFSVKPSYTASKDVTVTRSCALTAGKYYLTFQPNQASTGDHLGHNYLFLKKLVLTKTADTAPTPSRIVISRKDGVNEWVLPAGATPELSAKVFPYGSVNGWASQAITWSIVQGAQSGYVSMKNNDGKLTASALKNYKGSNVVSVTDSTGREEVVSVATGSQLYAFNNVAKEYLTKNSLTSVTLDNFDDYSKITSDNKWAYMENSSTIASATVYQAHKNNDGAYTGNERYGVFLDYSTGTSGNLARFKIKVDKSGWYFPEVMYRDNGPTNMRAVDVYLSPTNVDPYTLKVMTITPKAENETANGGLGVISAKRSDDSMYLAQGEYYLTIESPVVGGRYLYLYHLALAEDDARADVLAPKAVVIEKPAAAMKPLAVNDTVKLSARVLPLTTLQDILFWKSSNESVATVDENGNVTAVGEGVTLITATARDARSEAVVIQVGENSQVYAFNEVIKKYLEVGDDAATNDRRVDISTNSTFTDEGYLWQNTYNFGNSWRLIEKSSDSISTAYRGDSAQDDGDIDNTDPNYKYGLFLLSNSNDSYARFEIDVKEDAQYTAEILQYLSVNASPTQGTRQVELYISPIATPAEDLLNNAYYVGTTQQMKDTRATEETITDVGLNSQTFENIHLKEGKYNFVIRGSSLVGRYIYLHAFALHKKGEFVAPNPQDIVFNENPDETLYMSGNATYDLSTQIHSLLADQSIIWASDNEAVATVANGVITTKNVTEGTALITASSAVDPTVKGKVRVIIGDEAKPSYKYDFVNPIRSYAGLDTNQNIANSYNFRVFDSEFYGSYAPARNNGSDPWMLYSTNDPNNYCNYTVSTHQQGYGLFVMSSKEAPGTEVKFKFQVDKDANYGASLNITDWNRANDFEVYVAPVNATNPTEERWRVADFQITKKTFLNYGLELTELPLYAGEYILTIKSTKVNFTGTNGGLISVHDLSLYRTGDAFYTIEGAQVRTKGNQGLRFISTIHKSEFNVDSSEIKEFGTVLLPKRLFDEGKDGSDLVIGYKSAVTVPAKNRYVDNSDYVSFTAVLTGLNPANYKMVVVARAYAILNDGTVIYGDTWTERSIYDVAANGLARNPNMGDTERAALEKIVADAE